MHRTLVYMCITYIHELAVGGTEKQSVQEREVNQA